MPEQIIFELVSPERLLLSQEVEMVDARVATMVEGPGVPLEAYVEAEMAVDSVVGHSCTLRSNTVRGKATQEASWCTREELGLVSGPRNILREKTALRIPTFRRGRVCPSTVDSSESFCRR